MLNGLRKWEVNGAPEGVPSGKERVMAHDAVLPELSRMFLRRWSSAFTEITRRHREWVHQRRVYKKTFSELALCSDSDLADISISRYDIPGIAAEAARMASREQLR